MRNFQQNLLIVLALGLCGLCVWQWTDQSSKRRALEKAAQEIYDRDKAIQGYTNSLATSDREIAEFQRRLDELKQSIASNEDMIVVQKRQIFRLQTDGLESTNALAAHKAAVTNLSDKLTVAYEGIKKQNAAIQELAAQRDMFIGKYTNSVNDRNDLVKQYNDLVDRVKKAQAAAGQPGESK